MKKNFSIRTKVLTTYVVLVVLVATSLLIGISRLRQMGSRLGYLRTAYLPMARTTDTFSHLYHLDDSFDVHKILANRNNPLFIDSLRVASPQLLEESLRKQVLDARESLRKHQSKSEEGYLDRITVLVDELLNFHHKYLLLIASVLEDLRNGRIDKVSAQNEKLIENKRWVRSKLENLTQQIDQRIQNAVFTTDAEARKTIWWATILSLITVFIAAFVGFIALLALRPLNRLKETVQKIGAGALDQRVQITSSDEVGELGREFNRMADSIQLRDEALHKQQESLVQSEKMAVVGRMASKISHEVRNPLNAIGLNIELLQDEAKSPSAKKTLETMAKEIDRLNLITENYLSMSRTQKINSEVTDIRTLVQNIQNFVNLECNRRNLTFSSRIEEDVPSIKADPTRLEQALINLLKNAMEASKEGKTIGINAQKENSHLKIDIWDQGSGIPQNQIVRIFDPFFTTKEKGTGLGLSITQEIIRQQGGTLTVKSSPNEGTTFTITLPT